MAPHGTICAAAAASLPPERIHRRTDGVHLERLMQAEPLRRSAATLVARPLLVHSESCFSYALPVLLMQFDSHSVSSMPLQVPAYCSSEFIGIRTMYI